MKSNSKLKAWTPHPVRCPCCGDNLYLIIPKKGNAFYGCGGYRSSGCTSVAAAHKKDFSPMTLPTCDQNIKDARGRAHKHLDELWRLRDSQFKDSQESTGRRKAYEWLTEQRPFYVHWLAQDNLVHIGFLESIQEIEDVLTLCVKKKKESWR